MASPLRTASLHGALAGLIYGLIEYAFIVVRPMLQWQRSALGPAHWIWEAAFLSLYVILGAGIGSLATKLPVANVGRAATRLVIAVATLALAATRLSTEKISGPNLAFDLTLASLALVMLGSLFFFEDKIWLSWMCSPWVIVPLVLTLIKVGDASGGALPLLEFSAGVAIAVFVVSRFGPLRRILQNRYLSCSLAGCGALLVALPSLTVLLSGAPSLPEAKSGPKLPNVVLIILDTVRADHMSVYGYGRKTTPNLDMLAPEGVLFRNAISSSDITLGSHASMFTGLYTSWHRAHPAPPHDQGRLDSSFRTLAQTLSEHGYTTFADLANCAYLRPEFGLTGGFGYYDVRPSVRRTGGGGEYYLRPLVRPILEHLGSTAEIDRVYRRADQITGDGLRLLTAMRRRAGPFFLTLNYMDAHDPYIPPPPYRDLFPGRNPAFHNQRVPELREEMAVSPSIPVGAELTHIVSQYDGGIAFMDAEVKRLLDEMKQSGIYDDTLIIVTADHGEGLGERGIQGHPASVHQELVHVPLWVKYPSSSNIQAGRKLDTLVSSVDIMPTVLDIAGIPIPPELQGQSLRTLDAGSSRPVFSESFIYDHLGQLRGRSDAGQRALYHDSWKLLATTNGKMELYDWKADPTESQDLIAANPAVSKRLNEELEQWMLLIPHPKLPVRKTDRQTLDHLRALGYLQ